MVMAERLNILTELWVESRKVSPDNIISCQISFSPLFIQVVVGKI